MNCIERDNQVNVDMFFEKIDKIFKPLQLYQSRNSHKNDNVKSESSESFN
jgi:hypothetical protein